MGQAAHPQSANQLRIHHGRHAHDGRDGAEDHGEIRAEGVDFGLEDLLGRADIAHE